ncbi:MAG: hypothetical protein DWH81_15950 [Planctomycetota bacterium]|nr:MAG: hypothetical protein DWH81_15950 [Planctomycetota bacterium]
MNEEMTPQNAPAMPGQAVRHWPWGQVTVFLLGFSLCLHVDRAAIDIIEMAVVWVIEKLAWLQSPFMLGAIVCAVPTVAMWRRAARDGSSTLHVPWLRKANIVVWSVFFLSMLLSMLIPAFVSAYMAAQRSHSQALASEPWSVHSFVNDSFQLSTPSNWELAPDPSLASVGIRLTDPLNDSHLVSSFIPKQDLADTSLDAFRQHIVQTLQQSISDLSIEKSHSSQIDGHPAVFERMTGAFDGVNIVLLSCMVEYPDRWVEVRLGTTRSRFPENEAMFEKIAATLQQKR